MSSGPTKTAIEVLFESVPEDGIVVRDEADGFHARFNPVPQIPMAQVAAVLGGWCVVCSAVAWVAAGVTELRLLIVAGGMTLGGLMYAFHIGRGFFPVEVAASSGVLYFDGDRRPLGQVRGAELHGVDLRVYDLDGAVVAEAHGVSEDVGRWLVAAIDTMAQGAQA